MSLSAIVRTASDSINDSKAYLESIDENLGGKDKTIQGGVYNIVSDILREFKDRQSNPPTNTIVGGEINPSDYERDINTYNDILRNTFSEFNESIKSFVEALSDLITPLTNANIQSQNAEVVGAQQSNSGIESYLVNIEWGVTALVNALYKKPRAVPNPSAIIGRFGSLQSLIVDTQTNSKNTPNTPNTPNTKVETNKNDVVLITLSNLQSLINFARSINTRMARQLSVNIGGLEVVVNELVRIGEIITNGRRDIENAHVGISTLYKVAELQVDVVKALLKGQIMLFLVDTKLKKEIEVTKTLNEVISNISEIPLQKVKNSVTTISALVGTFEALRDLYKEIGITETLSRNTEKLVAGVRSSIEAIIQVMVVINTIPEALAVSSAKKMVAVATVFDSFKEVTKAIALSCVGLTAIALMLPTATLGLLSMGIIIGGISRVMVMISKLPQKDDIKDKISTINEFGKLCLICSGVMLMGALVGGYVNRHLGDIFGFALTLGAFIFLVGKAASLSGILSKEGTANLVDFGILVAISATVLLFGGMIVTMYPEIIQGSLLFGVILGSFILVLGYALSLTGGIDPKTPMYLGVMVAVVGAVLLFAGYFLINNPLVGVGAMLFAVLLGTFILVVGAGLGFMGDIDWRSIIALGAMVAICGAVLLFAGSMFVENPAIGVGVFMFGIILSAFIGFLVVAMSIPQLGIGGVNIPIIGHVQGMGLSPSGMMTVAKSIALVTAVCGGVLLKAGSILADNPMIGVYALGFAIGLGAYIFALVKVLEYAQSKSVSIGMGSLALMGIGVATGIFALDLLMINKATKDLDWEDLGKFAAVVGVMTLAVLGVGELAVGTVGIGAGVIAAGCGLLTLVGASLASLGVGMISIGMGMKQFNEIGDPTTLAGNVKTVLGTLCEAIYEVYDAYPDMFDVEVTSLLLGQGGNVFVRVVRSVRQMGQMISDLASGIQEFAELRMPIYDERGNKVGYRNMSQDDFDLASENIGKIISTIGGALNDTFYEHQDWFSGSVSLQSILSGESYENTPFAMVIRGCGEMGRVVSQIGKGVAEFASLQIPEYDKDGVATGKYVKLEKTEIDSAVENIATVISTIGKGFLQAYNSDPNFWGGGFWSNVGGLGGLVKWALVGGGGEHPVAMVTRGMLNMTDVISRMVGCIADMATMRYPKKFDENGNPTEWELVDDTMKEQAVVNIASSLMVIPQALINLYNNNKKMFEDWDIISESDASDTPMAVMIRSMMGMGGLISDITDAIVHYASANIPIKWDKNGHPTEYQPLNETIYEKALQQLVGKGGQINVNGGVSENGIIPFLAVAISRLYGLKVNVGGVDTYVFQDPSWIGQDAKKTPFGMVVSAMEGLGGLVKGITDSIISLASGKRPIYENGKQIGYETLNDTIYGKAIGTLNKIMTTIPNGIASSLTKKQIELLEDMGESKVFEVIKTAIGTISPIIQIIEKLGGESGYIEIPVLDENGVIKEFKKVSIATGNANLKSIITDAVERIQSIGNIQFTSTSHSNGDKIQQEIKAKLDNISTIIGQIEKMNNMVISLAQANTEEVDISGSITNMQAITNGLNGWILQINAIESINQKNIDEIGKLVGVLPTLIDSVGKAKKNDAFAQNTKEVGNLVKTINTINVQKVSQLTSMVNAMNKFAKSVGNMDKLTEAISQKLSTELKALTLQLSRSEQTIKQSENIHTKRVQAIKDSLKEIEKIMQYPIEVQYKRPESSESGSNGGSGSGSSVSTKQGQSHWAQLKTTIIQAIDSSKVARNH